MSRSATSTRFLNPSGDGDSPTALGSLVQCLTTLSGKKFFLMSNLNLPWRNWRPFSTFISSPGEGTQDWHIFACFHVFFFFQLRWGHFWNNFTLSKELWEIALSSYSSVTNHKMHPRRRNFSNLYQFHTTLMTGFSMEKLVCSVLCK